MKLKNLNEFFQFIDGLLLRYKDNTLRLKERIFLSLGVVKGVFKGRYAKKGYI